MPSWPSHEALLNHPVKSLVFLFTAWKAILILIAVTSPGPGYDTSTIVAYREHRPLSLSDVVSSKLFRWDAIHFVAIASRGNLYEQDWAFGWGLTRSISFVAQCLKLVSSSTRTCTDVSV